MSDKKIIDGYALEKAILDAGRSSSNPMLMTLTGFVTKFVNDAPEAIVRCKDCRFHDDEGERDSVPQWLPCAEIKTADDWFCADGIRK